MSAFCLLNSWPSSAADIVVRVLDASDQTPLPGATLAVLGTEFGGYANEEGYCRVEGLPPGQYDLLCSHIGYRSHTLRGVVPGDEERVVALEPTAVEVPELVVSAARRSQTFAQAPISISVADAERIADHNAFSLTGPLRYVSGISQVGSQPVVRGSSGFSRGTGSRLLMLVDGFPMLSSDLGDIKWDAVPLQQVERVEVVKGAGSALYGTGALGGVINVLTRDPAREPGTRFRLLSGLYSQPAYSQWRWTEKPMHFVGFDLSHNRVLGRTGLALSGGHNRGTGYHQNGDGRRYHLYTKAVHRFSPTSYWRVMGNWAQDDHGVFVLWRDRSHPLAVPESDAPAHTVSWKLHLNSEYYHLVHSELGYRLKTGYYRTGFTNNAAAGGLASDGHKISGEGQFDYTGLRGWNWTLGLASVADLVRSPGDFLGTRSLMTVSGYAQGVYEISPLAEWTTGLRYDWSRLSAASGLTEGPCGAPPVDSKSIGEFSPQVGFSYRLSEATALRASLGRGFRVPSVLEVFSQAEASGIRVCPNPALDPERAWSGEVGIKQGLAKWLALDMALFWNEYRELIEARPDPYAGGTVPVARFLNLARARVAGFESEILVALPLGLGARATYTLVDGVEFLDGDQVLPPYCHGDYGDQAPLPYRSRHVLNLGLQGERGPTSGRVNFQYLSRFERVSGLFAECGRDYVPIYLLDVQLSRQLGPLRLNLRVDNALQYYYATIERKIRPLRRISLSVDGAL